MTVRLIGFYSFLFSLSVGAVVNSQSSGEYQWQCETIRTPQCKSMPYNETIFPNFLDHKTQDDAKRSFDTFTPLIQYNCSLQLLPLLCFYYFPVCTTIRRPIPPCRKLCQQAQTGCLPILKKFGFRWPGFLNCDEFPITGLCVGENHTTPENTSSPSVSDVRKIISGNRQVVTPGDIDWSEYPETEDDADRLQLFLLVSTMHDVVLYDMATNDLINLYSGIDQGAAIDFHYKKNLIYWASYDDSRIYRGHLTRDVLRDVHLIVDTASTNIESIAVDWITDHLFWLQTYPAAIRVATLDGADPTILVSTELTNPKSLILDPINERLFWLDRMGTLYSPSANVESYNLRLKRHTVIFNITQTILPGMGRPMGLTADLSEQRLYWVDARSESVQSIDYNGNDFKIILRSESHTMNYLTEPRSIAIFGEYMFWSDTVTQSIIKAEKTGSTVRKLKEMTSSPPLDIKVFHGNKQKMGLQRPQYVIQLEESTSTVKPNSFPVLRTSVLFHILIYLLSFKILR